MTSFTLDRPQRLGRYVVIGYCDIAAAGIRVLEGMSGTSATADASGLRETGREALTFSGMGGAVFDGLPPLEAVHFDEGKAPESDGHDEPSVTLLKLNAAVGQDLAASLSLSLVDLLADHRATLDRVVIAAAIQPPKRHQLPREATSIPSDVVCTFSCDGDRSCSGESSSSPPAPAKPLPASLSNLPALPAGARLADSFLTTLVRLCRLEGLPLTLLARAGYRTTGAAPDLDGTDEAIKGLGECLAKVAGLEFSLEKACGVRRSKWWQGVGPAQLVPGYI